jgi:hypothetical protein
MDADFADLCENVNNFSKDGIFASDRSDGQQPTLGNCIVKSLKIEDR